MVALIEELFRIGYCLAGVSLLLRRGGWWVQVPGRRVIERDGEAVEVWKQQVWPTVEPRWATWAPGSVGRTGPVKDSDRLKAAPGAGRGQRPQVRVHGGDQGGRVSVAGPVCHRLHHYRHTGEPHQPRPSREQSLTASRCFKSFHLGRRHVRHRTPTRSTWAEDFAHSPETGTAEITFARGGLRSAATASAAPR
ncbi:helix-turn-helix domain-containing protein [Spirillospora sp. CA-253888]